jgi:signal transduction histidine kinase/ActR/RegA family two-component response regulator
VVGGRSVDFAHPDDVERMESAFRSVVAGDVGVRVRWRGRRTDGGWVWLESSPSLIDGAGAGEEPQFLDVMRDISAQVAQENALAEATEAAQAAAAAKAEFLANMSHEIRTPLTSVLGFASLLAERDDLSEQARNYVDRIGSASRGLLAIVNDVLDFSSLEQGRVEIKPRSASAVEVVRDALLMFKSQAEAKDLLLEIETSLDPAARVLIDPERVRQVLLNLIGNAVKFTEAGAVTVRLTAAAGRLAVEVRDTGAGLDAEQQDRLFQRFSQVDGSSTRRHGGTGLGLAICKGLVEAMGGIIGVRSVRGQGSVFHFEIAAPGVAEDMRSRAKDEAVALSIEGVRVLVADDNFANRELVRAMLERLGAEVTDAADGLEAVEAAKLMPYDVILMDLRMPRLGGVEALARLRREEGPNQAVPVIAFSAEVDPALEPAASFDGFVAKPIDAQQLIHVVWAAAFDALDGADAEADHG